MIFSDKLLCFYQ